MSQIFAQQAVPSGRGMKASTIRDVARRAEVSVASVSRVLTGTGSVAEATRARVMSAVEALSYVPHSGARSLSTSRTDTVGVILPDLFGEFFSELIRGMDLAARQHGLHLIVSSSHDDADQASQAIRSMRGRVDGMIVLSPHLDAANLASALAGDLPVLLMNGGADADRPSIVVDNHGGAVVAVRHLIDGGARAIVHIAGPTGNLEAEARLAGYLEAVAEAGLQPRVVDGDFSQASGRQAIQALVRDGTAFDAVFAANDVMAIGALLTLQDAGLRCPDDVAVIGFDDIPISALVRPSLSTMGIDIAQIGRRAMDRLAALIGAAPGAQAEPACERITPRLRTRQSSRDLASSNHTPVSQDPFARRQLNSGEPQDV